MKALKALIFDSSSGDSYLIVYQTGFYVLETSVMKVVKDVELIWRKKRKTSEKFDYHPPNSIRN